MALEMHEHGHCSPLRLAHLQAVTGEMIDDVRACTRGTLSACRVQDRDTRHRQKVPPRQVRAAATIFETVSYCHCHGRPFARGAAPRTGAIGLIIGRPRWR
jgi:hypothetical protein